MKKALSSLDLPENVGCIVRTAALDQTREELERDYHYLMRLLREHRDAGEEGQGAGTDLQGVEPGDPLDP